MPRPADLGLHIGSLPSGPTGSILDVPGVGLGHATVWRDEPRPPAGRGVARTGVSVLDLGGDAWASPVPAGAAVLNGAGECTGLLSVREWGLLESPVFLTSTMQLGRVYDAACTLMLAERPEIADDVVIPVVGECDDSFLSYAGVMQVTQDDVAAAWAEARASAGSVAAPAEGAVGAGTGMSCFGWKGGIGSASRVLPDGHTVGVLVLANFGQRDRLTVDGTPVGRVLEPPQPAEADPPPAGSCIGVVVTDAPLDHHACDRLATRVGLGLARVGSTAHHGSGEIFLCAATGLRAPRGSRPDSAGLGGRDLDPYFEAVVDATEEAVLTVLLTAVTTVGRDGNTSHALPVDAVLDLVAGPSLG
ncbi:MAG: P1 family peptidase [Candidatus Nanopelagicales bacterium]